MDQSHVHSRNDTEPVQPARPQDFLEREQSIPARFRQVVTAYAANPALGSGEWQPTYAELDRAGNRLAHKIMARGGQVGDRIAVLMRHDTPQMAAVLAILKAGRVVVVMNPSDPAARLAQVMEDAEPFLLLSDEENHPRAAELGRGKADCLRVQNHLADGCAEDPALEVNPQDLAFVVYTSGSTGRPKGIMQSHCNLLHNVWRLSLGMQLSAQDRLMMPASLSGAHGVATWACALLNGATLCPFPAMERGVTSLADWVNAHSITVFVASASLFRHFVKTLHADARFPGVRLVRLGSEAATAADFAAFRRHFSSDSILFHTLSSSETGNITQARFTHGSRVPAGRLPVGKTAAGVALRLLNEEEGEVDSGQVGEIVVRSRYLSPGYWRNPRLTAERFASVNGSGDERLYRTGDLGRWNEQGQLLFLGRKDAQVKIRGYRVELSEVEDALQQQPEVDKAAVCAQTEANGDARLVAWLVAGPGQTCPVEPLRQRLQASLPSHMVPSAFVLLDDLPLTPHGKIDREKLRNLRVPELSSVQDDPPRTETEVLLAGQWRQELQCESVNRQSDFFALGGDSLSAAVVAARIHAALQVELDLRSFVAHPRLAELAAAIDRLPPAAGASASEPLVRVSREDRLPLSFAQERAWKDFQAATGPTGYVMASSHRIRGPLRVEVLRDCLNFLHRRHEILRTTFHQDDAGPVQVVHPPEPVPLPVTDLSSAPDAMRQAAERLRAAARQPFDLARGPLLRLQLVRLGKEEHGLLRVNHHIISDAWSWKVYFRELALLYEARLQGQPPPLSECEPLQYADYAAWQRRTLDPRGRKFQEAVQWWAQQLSGRPRAVEPRVRRWVKPRRVDATEGFLWWGLEPALSQRLDRFARAAGASYYAVRLAAWAALLAAETGHSDLLLGAYVTNRNRVEWQNMFGFFSNVALLRLRFDPRRTFSAWVESVQETVAETQARAEIPCERLREELRGCGVPLPDARAYFSVADHEAALRFGGLELTALDRRVEAPGGFHLTFDQHNEARHCRLVFDARRYSPPQVRAFIARYVRLLELVSTPSEAPLSEVMRPVARSSGWSRLWSR